MARTVGRFTIDGDSITGPAEYMTERGNELLDRIMAGDDAVFNTTAHYSPDVEMAVLVRIQTDFAGWMGARQMMQWAER